MTQVRRRMRVYLGVGEAVLQVLMAYRLWFWVTMFGQALTVTMFVAFWITDSLPVTHAVFQTHEFARYPLTIYSSWIRVLLTWIIPYGMVSFYPASELTGHNPGLMAWVPPMMALALLTVGYRLWVFGLRHYSGTGS